MATAKKLPSGNYRCLVYTGLDERGNRKYKSITAPTKKEAELLASQYVVELEEKANDRFANIDTTFANMFNSALEIKKVTAKSQNTIQKDLANYKRFITDEFASMDIRKIDSLYLKEYTIQTLTRINQASGKKLPYKSYMGYKSILLLAFSYADEHDICRNFISNKNKFKDKDFANFYDCTKKKAEEKAFSPEQITAITQEIYRRMRQPNKYGKCYTCGYMFLLSANTGMRVGELCSLKWSDILEDSIHIHSQQLINHSDKTYVYAEWTKNEKGISQDGRMFPITKTIRTILNNLKADQKESGIQSEWVFANADGSWITSDNTYEKFLWRICKSLGYEIHNNHAIRMYFNSYVLIMKGVPVTNRAKLLGHSVEVNLKNYSFEEHDYCSSTKSLLDA